MLHFSCVVLEKNITPQCVIRTNLLGHTSYSRASKNQDEQGSHLVLTFYWCTNLRREKLCA